MEYTFTGQMSYMDDPITSETTEGFGLMFFNARWLDPAIGRFAQADSIVPPGVQGLDRYAYVNNNPLNYIDPSGHDPIPSFTYTFSVTQNTALVASLNTASNKIGKIQGLQKAMLMTGAIIFTVGAAAIGGEKGLEVGAAIALGAYAVGQETLLDQYANDITELDHIVDFVNSVDDGNITVTIDTVNIDLSSDSDTLNIIASNVTYQVITLCDSSSSCQSFTTSFSPANQRIIDKAFNLPKFKPRPITKQDQKVHAV
jgi:RHS repeat-associated protein